MNDLITKNKAAMALPELFSDFNFEDLNKSIEVLANTNRDLSEDEKQSAVVIVEDWEQNVIQRLNDHKENLSAFVEYLDLDNLYESNRYYHRNEYELDEDQRKELAAQTGTVAELQVFIDAQDELRIFKNTRPDPEDLADDLESSLEDRITARKDAEKDMAIWETKVQRLERKERKAMLAWKRALRENPDIQKLLAYVRKYKRNMSKFTNECTSKSQLARLNISISSEETRTALRELLEFARKI